MTWFDLLVVAVLAASTAFAVVRGALKEIGTLVVLGGGAAAGWFLAKPVAAAFGAGASFLTLAAFGGVIALVAFLGLYFLLHAGLRRLPLKGASKRTDRIAGGVFGFARGLALIGLGFLAYSYYLDEARRPTAVNKALTLPLAKVAAAFFESFAPQSAGDLDGEGPKAGANENAAADGYGRGDRAALAEIVSTVTTSDGAPPPAAAPATGDAIASALSELDPE
jgi:uncharacterized membrane protein required for colicin V production